MSATVAIKSMMKTRDDMFQISLLVACYTVGSERRAIVVL